MASVVCEGLRFVHAKGLKILTSKQVYIEKKYSYDCFTNLSEDKSILMTSLWCPAFSNHG